MLLKGNRIIGVVNGFEKYEIIEILFLEIINDINFVNKLGWLRLMIKK